MSMTHRIQQGETCAHVAARHGVPESAVWNDPANRELADRRTNPNVLFPGDELTVRSAETDKVGVQADQRHRFRRLEVPLTLRLELRDGSGEPLAGCECELQLGAQTLHQRAGDDGRLEVGLPLDVSEAELRVRGATLTLLVGHLDPVSELSGWRERLNNLGYHAGDCDDDDCEQRRYALEEFQCDHGLTVDGICGPKTQAKLVEIHGC